MYFYWVIQSNGATFFGRLKKVRNGTTTISSKYQLVIPRKIREQFHLKPGQKLAFIPYKNSIRLVIVPDVKAAYGFLEGIDTSVDRDQADRL